MCLQPVLHAPKGSQNGQEHSAPTNIGHVTWSSKPLAVLLDLLQLMLTHRDGWPHDKDKLGIEIDGFAVEF